MATNSSSKIMEQSNDTKSMMYNSDYKGIAFTKLHIDEDDIKATSSHHTKSPIETNCVTSSGHIQPNSNEADSVDVSPTSDTTDGKNDDAKSKASFAFTIDFNNGKNVDNKRHREISERIQMRQRQHRRGVSLSKLDDSVDSLASSMEEVPIGVSNGGKPPLREKGAGKRQVSAATMIDSQAPAEAVVLRRRPPGVTTGDVGNKRHSWSPRTSIRDEVHLAQRQQPMQSQPMQPSQPQQQRQPPPQTDAKQRITNSVSTSSFSPKSSTLQRAMEGQQRSAQQSKSLANAKFSVVTTPLEYVRLSDDADAASEAGTYTLDGDHYTEEEKARMSIDKDNSAFRQKQTVSTTVRGSGKANSRELGKNTAKTIAASAASNPSKRPSTAASKKESYLDRIKFGVKAFGESKFNKLPLARQTRASSEIPISTTANDSSDDKDMGTFTSVTSCGVLNKSTAMGGKHPLYRRNHLTKLQIDASEYIQPCFRSSNDNMMRSYTDYEKAKQNQYQLKIFSTGASSNRVAADSYDQLEEDGANDNTVGISLKTAPTKNDWIQEWARNARRRNMLLSTANAAGNTMDKTTTNQQKPASGPHSKPSKVNNHFDQPVRSAGQSSSEFGDDVPSDHDDNVELRHPNTANATGVRSSARSSATRPPISPTKIPSPMHSAFRARGISATRSFRSSNPRIDNLDTEMYLEKTAEAISYLNKLHRNNASYNGNHRPQTSPRNCTSPSHCPNYSGDEPAYRSLSSHKRNLSLDGTSSNDFSKLAYGETFDGKTTDLMDSYEYLRRRGHVRSNSYENRYGSHDGSSAVKQQQQQQRHRFDQTSPSQRKKYVAEPKQHTTSAGSQSACHEAVHGSQAKSLVSGGSPMRRSTSFSMQKRNNNNFPSPKTQPKSNSIMKSASSSSFKKLSLAATTLGSVNVHDVDDDDDDDDDYSSSDKYYAHDASDINSNEYANDRDAMNYMSDSMVDRSDGYEDSMSHYYSRPHAAETQVSQTRYNKAFMIRKQFAANGSGPPSSSAIPAACPNTPEMPRRNVTQRASFHDRKSVPRDSSLSRIKQDLPNFKTMKKSLAESGASVAPSLASSAASTKSQNKVLPKYLDISKYKTNSAQGQTFLRRDESRSTLVNRMEIRKSPSAIGLMKVDTMGAGNGSVGVNAGRVKSAGAKLGGTANKANKGREVELAMWKRRSTYDPMKAAAEGKKKLDGNKRSVQRSADGSSIWRSQSFHGGVGQTHNGNLYAVDISKTESLLSSGDDDEDNGEFIESS